MPTVLITGAVRGIGQATAELFLENNYQVVALDRKWDGSTLADHPSLNRIDFDLQNLAKIPHLVNGLGQIDVLVNNAGVLYVPPIDQFPTEQKREILTINRCAC